MGHGVCLAKLKSPELKDCGNLKCDYAFWGYGNQKYCSKECAKDVEKIKQPARMKKWRKENPEKVREIRRRYYEKNKKKMSAYQREYRERKKEKDKHGNN